MTSRVFEVAGSDRQHVDLEPKTIGKGLNDRCASMGTAGLFVWALHEFEVDGGGFSQRVTESSTPSHTWQRAVAFDRDAL